MKTYEFITVDLEWLQPESKERRASLGFSWSAKGIGFGELTFFVNKEGEWKCNSETMSNEFVEATLLHWFRTKVTQE